MNNLRDLNKYKKNPQAFLTDVLDVKKEHIWHKMDEVVDGVKDNKWVAVKAGHSLSKSYSMSRIALWFLYCFPPATVITTAPSFTQVEDILWREIRTAYNSAKVKLGGSMTRTKLELAPKWFATGFSTRPDTVTQQATRVQGFHNENVMIIFDEAAGIETPIWEAAASLMTAGNCKFIAIGNPTSAKGEFVQCFRDKKFKKVTISVKDSPNYVEGKEVIPGLSGREFEEDIRNKYGETSNYYKSRVLGQIPDEDADALVPLSWVENAEGREAYPQYRFKKRFLTYDVADGGDDRHVIKAWENMTEIGTKVLRDMRVEEAEPYVWRMLKEYDCNCVVVDGDGIGRVAIQLLEASCPAHVTVLAFKGSDRDAVRDKTVFYNRRNEGYWQMRKMFEEQIISISRDDEQREELTAIKLTDDRRGFITVMKKKDIKEELGRSPDKCDAIMMACAEFDNVPKYSSRPDAYAWDGSREEYELTPETV